MHAYIIIKYLKNILQHNKNIIFNIPHCPQFNPIKYVFNVMKMGNRNNNIDTYTDLVIYIDQFVRDMNKSKLLKFFEKSYNNLFN